MKEMRKDIFGNVYTVNVTKPPTFEQKLKEAKAKQRYKKFQAEQRAMQIAKIKSSASKSKQGLQKIGSKTKSVYSRATDSRLSSLKEKLRGSIYGKDKM